MLMGNHRCCCLLKLLEPHHVTNKCGISGRCSVCGLETLLTLTEECPSTSPREIKGFAVLGRD